MQYKCKPAERFVSNATTNGVWATQTTDLFHINPDLNPEVDRGIDIHTCNDIKDCISVSWMSNFYLSQRSDSCSLAVLKSIHAWYCSSATAHPLYTSRASSCLLTHHFLLLLPTSFFYLILSHSRLFFNLLISLLHFSTYYCSSRLMPVFVQCMFNKGWFITEQ